MYVALENGDNEFWTRDYFQRVHNFVHVCVKHNASESLAQLKDFIHAFFLVRWIGKAQ